MAKVACHLPNGIMLNLFKEGYDDGTGSGYRQMVRDGVGHRLNGEVRHDGEVKPGHTEVPDEWFATWLDQNKLNPLVTMNQVYVVDGEGTKGENPTT